MPSTERADCPICGPAASRETGWFYPWEEGTLPLVRCRGCGLVRLDPRPTVEGLEALYDDDYFDGGWDCGCTGLTYVGAGERLLEGYGSSVMPRIARFVPEGDLLDVGCAGGYFLEAARRAGYRVRGIEVNETMAGHARDQLGLDVVVGAFGPGVFEPGSFDVVHMGDVLEHVPDPLEAVRVARDVLRPGGLLWIAAPLSYGMGDPRRRPAYIDVPPYHIFEFTPDTLRRLVREGGFRIEESSLAPLDRKRSPLAERLLRMKLRLAERLPTSARGAERIDLAARAG
jgi:SAM-dependent methyltransferase